MVCTPVRSIIHLLKLVDYFSVAGAQTMLYLSHRNVINPAKMGKINRKRLRLEFVLFYLIRHKNKYSRTSMARTPLGP